MYEVEPSEADLAVAGLTLEDLAADPVEIWPENLRAFELFHSLRRQWRIAPMGGALGLDFAIAFHRMDRMGLTPEEYNQLDEDLQVMEDAALEAMRSKE